MKTKDIKEESLKLHEKNKGKLEITGTIEINRKEDLFLAYTPGVAEPCREIFKNKENAYKYTIKGKTVAIISNGTSVLGLGDIGALASLPVIEGKSLLLKRFGNVNAMPICIDSTDSDRIIDIIKGISPGFGGIHLEDIKAPECFYIEDRLRAELDIPVYHDDQHGTAIAVLAGLINALKVVKKDIKDIKVVINGAGASGIATAKLLISAGVKDIVLCDIQGALVKGDKSLNFAQENMAEITNNRLETGELKDIVKGKDVFIGVSVGDVLNSDMVKTMNKDSIIFALANPVPEILPEEAKKGGARIVATGRSDFPNQINNVLVFPGIFKGMLKSRLKDVTDEIKIKSAIALANLVSEDKLNEDYIIPGVFEDGVADAISNTILEIKRVQG